MLLALALAASGCTATDGDTLRCGEERIRLTGIDAPELHGCQPRGRRCAPGDGRASRRVLAALINGQQLRIVRLGKDRFGRTLAAVFAGKTNLACAQLRAGQAIYRADWDDRGIVRRDCPALAR
jgi:endonuclease YncB( thermonuclease family)